MLPMAGPAGVAQMLQKGLAMTDANTPPIDSQDNSQHSSNFGFLALGVLCYFLFGLSYSYLLVAPALRGDLAITQLGNLTLSYISLFYLGKFIAGVFDRRLPTSAHGFFIPLTFLISLLGLLVSQYNLYGSSFLFGFAAVLGGVSLREHLAQSSSITQKRTYNTLTTLGWSGGVAFQGLLFKSGISEVATLVLVMFGASIILVRRLKPITHAQQNGGKPPSLVTALGRLFATPVGWTLFYGSVLYLATITLINSHLVAFIKGHFFVETQYLSFVLALPILGATLSLLPKSLILPRLSTAHRYLVYKFLTFMAAVFLFAAPNFAFFLVVLVFIGFFTNEEVSILYQLISERLPLGDRRQAHAFIEIFGLIGAGLGWLIGHGAESVRLSLSILLLCFLIFAVYNLWPQKDEVDDDL